MQAESVQYAGSFSYGKDTGFSFAVRYLYPVDLDNDGLDELMLAGFETQPNTPQDYSNTNLAIFGWQDGKLTNITSQWLPAGANQVEGVGDVAFGDFNNDGRVDAYLSGYADMSYQVMSYVLLNTGSSFTRKEMGLTAWEHGTAVGDLNRDGYDDVVVIGYASEQTVWLGSPSGLIAGTSIAPLSGSDGAIADFMGDGSPTLIVVDSGDGAAGLDTLLLRNPLELGRGLNDLLAVLPAPAFGIDSHDVRVLAFDFSDDGLDDAIVFSRPWFDGTTWPKQSAVQFLLNKGGGRFVDVTTERLVGYQDLSGAAYAPVLADFNGDGRLDLFLSEADFEATHTSTAFLLQQQDGTFLDSGRDLLSGLVSGGGGMASIVCGPDGYYLVTETQEYGGAAQVSYSRITFPERDASETLRGTRRDDVIEGRGGDDIVHASAGDDVIDGGTGIDVVVFAARRSGFEIEAQDNALANASTQSFEVTSKTSSAFGVTTLQNVERVRFDDISVALDLNGNAGSVAKTLGAVFGKEAVANAEYAGIGLSLMDAGMSYESLMDLALQVRLGGSPSHASVVDLLYTNVVGTAPSQAERDYFVGLLDTGAFTPASLGVLAAETSLNAINIDLVGLSQGGLSYVPVG